MLDEPLKGDMLAADFIATARWETLPEAVQRKARMTLLDNLAAALAGTRARSSQITGAYAARTWPGDKATILLRDRRASMVGAAFANGYAANAIDIDDNGQYTKGHPGAQVFATALAVSEAQAMDGARLLAAMVVGYEVAHRVGRCWMDHQPIYQACGSWGSVACAAVAANLMGLSQAQVQNALGLAEYHAPNVPIMRDVASPAMVKHGMGWGAMTGIMSAELAAEGFTGIPGILGFEQYQDWVSDIGQHYIMVDGVVWKTYACCTWAHAALKASQMLVRQHGIRAEDIAHILIEAPYEAVIMGTKLPATSEEAQFNLAWPLAALLVDGEIGPEQVLEHRLDDPRLRDLAQRIEAVESPELTQHYSELLGDDSQGGYGSAVTMTLKDGRTLASGVVVEDMSYPQHGWDEARMEEKFRWLVVPLLGEARTGELLDMLWHFENVTNVQELAQLLTP